MAYSVKEIYYTLQGEGAHTGRPAVFCRFSGCNLWSGREEDRGQAICSFCDTDFVGADGPGGGRFSTAEDLAAAVAAMWPVDSSAAHPFIVCTGGEPLLQLDANLVAALHERQIEIAVETNGTRKPPAGIDWLTVSPKAGAPVVVTGGNELKLVYPQEKATPEQYEHLAFDRWYLQPMDGPRRTENTRLTVEFCLAHPRWRLSIQTHKDIGLR
jgi:7-carboxy-7-deazaguanine synthase (Cx14CxxC type)